MLPAPARLGILPYCRAYRLFNSARVLLRGLNFALRRWRKLGAGCTRRANLFDQLPDFVRPTVPIPLYRHQAPIVSRNALLPSTHDQGLRSTPAKTGPSKGGCLLANTGGRGAAWRVTGRVRAYGAGVESKLAGSYASYWGVPLRKAAAGRACWEGCWGAQDMLLHRGGVGTR